MTFTVYIGLHRRNGVPARVAIGGSDPLGFARLLTDTWERLAQVHSRRSPERAHRLAEMLLRERWPDLAPLYRPITFTETAETTHGL